jgi:hypothetical protein
MMSFCFVIKSPTNDSINVVSKKFIKDFLTHDLNVSVVVFWKRSLKPVSIIAKRGESVINVIMG